MMVIAAASSFALARSLHSSSSAGLRREYSGLTWFISLLVDAQCIEQELSNAKIATVDLQFISSPLPVSFPDA
jgi:hypothetical protein